MKKLKFSIPPRYVLFFLTVLCVILLGINFVFPTALNPLREGVYSLFIPMQKGINRIGTAVSDELSALAHMRGAEEENRELRRELEAMQESMEQYALGQQELERLRGLLDLKNQYDSYPTVAAGVIQKESGNWFSSFIIDKGRDDGIRVDMNVLSGGGLCGIVTEVGPNYAKVLAIIDDDSNVSAMSASTEDSFVVAGDLRLYGEGCLRIEHADRDAVLEPGDMVVTSNISTKYLPGILIGYIRDASLDPNHLTRSGYLLPAADFDNLTHVLVITTLKADYILPEPESGAEEGEPSSADGAEETTAEESGGEDA